MNKIAIIGGSEKFHEFLELTTANLNFSVSASDAIRDNTFSGIILLPDYSSGEETVPQFSLDDMTILAKRKKEGFRIYAENYSSYNTYNVSVFGCEIIGMVCHINNEAICAFNEMQNYLRDGRILQAAGATYLPAISKLTDPYVLEKGVLLKKGHYVGTSQIAPSPVNDDMPILIQTGSVYTSLISLSNLDPVNFRPNSRWKKVYKRIFSFVLNVAPDKIEHAFNKCFAPLKTTLPLNSDIGEADWKSVCTNTLKKAVQWHFDSGIVIDDGTEGSFEMIMSNNAQKLYANRRVDAGFYTGWLLYAAGKYFDNNDWMNSGKKVFDFFVSRTQLQGGTLDGLFTWYYNENAAPHDIYSIDCGRDGIAMCNMYQFTGDTCILKKIERLAEGFSNWMNGDLLYSFLTTHNDEPSNKPHEIDSGICTPGIYGEMVSFMIMASKLLKNDKYLDIVIRIADKLVSVYPNYDYHGHTTSARNARLLFMLLCIQHTGKRDYSKIINVLIDYLSSIQHPCGGIYCEDNITFERNINVNCESGIISPWDNDYITDQLYVVNNSLAALSVLTQLPDNTNINKAKGVSMFKSLIEFVVKIQIDSEDKRFNGGWMRAFSITHNEYYGLDLDKFWGSYCIMAGWTMGIIPQAILTELTGECPYIIKD